MQNQVPRRLEIDPLGMKRRLHGLCPQREGEHGGDEDDDSEHGPGTGPPLRQTRESLRDRIAEPRADTQDESHDAEGEGLERREHPEEGAGRERESEQSGAEDQESHTADRHLAGGVGADLAVGCQRRDERRERVAAHEETEREKNDRGSEEQPAEPGCRACHRMTPLVGDSRGRLAGSPPR